MTEIKLVIFDCDGVLMDSEIIAAQTEAETYRNLGYEITDEEFAIRFAGSATADIKATIELELGKELPENLSELLVKNLDEACGTRAKMIEDADTILDLFDQPRCICSNSPTNRLQAMLKRTGLWDRFRPYVFSAKDLDPVANKPKPDIFYKALNEFEVTGREALVIEDSAHGIEGAIAAGCRVVGFTGASHTWPSHADVLTEAGAETVINRLSELPSLIDVFSRWEGLDG